MPPTMDVFDVIALSIYSNKNRIDNRTTLQKLIYFVSIIVPTVELKPYRHYFYGPFSIEVASALEEMSAFSILNEITHSGFYESYSYELTEKGQHYAKELAEKHPTQFKSISEIVHTCCNFCELNPSPLSYAAKAHYILTSIGKDKTKPFTNKDVADVGKDFDWNISENDAATGISLLEKLDLVR